ncbi:MAG: cytochrome c biogenesis protein CcsA [Ignavibacteriae bacterium]|nr:cytochrome c biogenesis protein CcsA [Ignavibacteriota bacterium]
MNFGQLLIWLAFFSALGAAYFFYQEGKHSLNERHRQKKSNKPLSAKLYLAMTGAVVVASLNLFYLLLTHQFQYSYVAKYSSLSQPALYLISAFWAGQEGTFLLWAVFVCVMAWVFLKTSKPTESYAMSAVSWFVAFLSLLLIVKSPFAMTVSTPADGSGMNPLLQDPWMAVHPPILFLGYAATIFPFALVVSALARRNYESWFTSGFAWTLFSALTLGAGIIIGGFWAYEVLGWGGFWGWDPVENSSLVPWLILLALVHGLLIQKTKGSLVRINMFLAIISFILVLYATFLTRSGVLADFSVHSFVDLGINNYLIAVMIVTITLGLGLFALRFRDLRAPKIDLSSLNRESALLLSLFVLGTSALFTFVGMSSPILTGFIGKASQVDASFYNKVNLPIAIALGLLLGITPFLGWTEETKFGILKRLSMPVGLTMLSCVIAYTAGVRSATGIVFVGSAAFGLISNVITAIRRYRSGWMSLGGPIAHIGVALLLIGIIGSGSFDETKTLALKTGEPQSVYGYQFTFKGVTEQQSTKPLMNIEVTDGKNRFQAAPKLYFSQYNQSMMREPDIKILPLKDIYISPLELRSTSAGNSHLTVELTRGEPKQIGGYTMEFVRFETGQHAQSSGMEVGAVLNVNIYGNDREIIPRMILDEHGERLFIPANLPLFQNSTKDVMKPQVTLAAMNVEEKKVVLALDGFDEHTKASTDQELLVEISVKPLMMVVWTGVIMMIAGTAVAFKRRIAQNGSV